MLSVGKDDDELPQFIRVLLKSSPIKKVSITTNYSPLSVCLSRLYIQSGQKYIYDRRW